MAATVRTQGLGTQPRPPGGQRAPEQQAIAAFHGAHCWQAETQHADMGAVQK